MCKLHPTGTAYKIGLPDANRMWQYHFNGHDDVEHKERDAYDSNTTGFTDFELDEGKFDEADEQMLVVRGANSLKSQVKTEKSIAFMLSKKFL